MILSFIRHGMTSANEKRLYCGVSDLPLSGRGRRELAALKKKLVYPAANLHITSGRARTVETLRVLYDREPDFVMEEFGELNFGDFEMKSYNDLKDSAAYQKWINGGCAAACPNGESRADLENRVKSGLRKLAEAEHESAVVITHGGVISVIMEALFPGEKNFYEWQPDCGRGYTLDICAPRVSGTLSGALLAEV